MKPRLKIDPALVKLFRRAVAYIATLPEKGPKKPSIAEKLQFYGCFKQATEGNVKGTIPSRLKPQARWKWEAWAKLKGVPAAKAMKKYLAYLKKMQPQWEKEAAKLAKSPPRQSKL